MLNVVVVGARAAGAATPSSSPGSGYDVVVVNRAVFPADTVSTHQIARPGMVQLHRWGLDAVPEGGTPPLRQVTFTAAQGTFIDERHVSVTSADDRAYTGTLLPPRTILWSNNSTWTKL